MCLVYLLSWLHSLDGTSYKPQTRASRPQTCIWQLLVIFGAFMQDLVAEDFDGINTSLLIQDSVKMAQKGSIVVSFPSASSHFANSTRKQSVVPVIVVNAENGSRMKMEIPWNVKV